MMIKVSRMAAAAVLAAGVLCLPAYAASAQTPTTTTADLADGSSCDGHEHGDLFANPDDPTSYYHCSWDVAYLKRCADPLHFDPALKICDRPEDADNPAAVKA